MLRGFEISEEFERCEELVNTSLAMEAMFEEEEEEQESIEEAPQRLSKRGRVQKQKKMDGFVVSQPKKKMRS